MFFTCWIFFSTLRSQREAQKIKNRISRALIVNFFEFKKWEKRFVFFTLQLSTKRKQTFSLSASDASVLTSFHGACTVHVPYFCYTWDAIPCFHRIRFFLFTEVQLMMILFSQNFHVLHFFLFIFPSTLNLSLQEDETFKEPYASESPDVLLFYFYWNLLNSLKS